MSRQGHRNRCYVCKEWVSHIVVRISQFNSQQGWHVVVPICQPCARQVMRMVVELSRQFQ